MANTEVDQTIAVDSFKRGLKKDLVMDIMRHENLPENLIRWMDTALDVEARYNSIYGNQFY